MNEYGIVEEILSTIKGRRGNQDYYFIRQGIKAKIIDQETKSFKIEKFNVRVVKDWVNSPFIALCPPQCRFYKEDQNVICRFRTGLIGRNILSETGITVSINGKNNITKISKRKK